MMTFFKRHAIAAYGGLVMMAVSGLVMIFGGASALALSGSQFQSGNIIDNGVFFDGGTMSSADVQNFLNAKVPQCDTSGSQMYNGSQTRAQYAATKGQGTPFTCMRDYRQETPSMPAENGLCGQFSGGNRSAAQIIRDAGAACGVNPQVLLVLLQKEQSLVTDTWPWSTQYGAATGFGCPDTAPCDPGVAGFFYQVYYAARQFKKYNRDANQYNYFRNSNNQIRYNPDAGCGAGTVFLNNQATTNLYIYTPYQPNAAALNNLYGTGDNCSAYGNRNFWRMFNDWFGSTHAAPFSWAPTSQEAYADAGRSLAVDTRVLSPNTRYYLRIKAVNTGNATWHNSGGRANNQVYVGTNGPQNRVSNFADGSWTGYNRPASLLEGSVAPGDSGTFEFAVTSPNAIVNQNESFNLVAEGQTWLNDVGLYWPMTTLPPTPRWQPQDQNLFYDSARTKPANSNLLAPDTTYYASLKLRNTGNQTWTNSGASPLRLGTNSPQDRASNMATAGWLAGNRAATLVEASVAPGQIGSFNFALRTPSAYGSYKEHFRPVVEGQTWLNDVGLYWPMNVTSPTEAWNVADQAVYADSSRTNVFNSASTPNDSRVYAVIKARNTGNSTWLNSGASPVQLGTNAPNDRTSPFYDSSWRSQNRVTSLQEASVAPGDIGTFAFYMRAPYAVNGSNFKEYFRPVVDGKAWLNDMGMYLPFTIQNGASLAWGLQSQEAYANSNYTNPVNTTQLKTNTTYYLRIKARNLSGATWNNLAFKLGTSNPNDRTSRFATSAWPAPNRAAVMAESSVTPGNSATFSFPIRTPATPVSNVQEYFTPVIDGQAWLPSIGLYYMISSTY